MKNKLFICALAIVMVMSSSVVVFAENTYMKEQTVEFATELNEDGSLPAFVDGDVLDIRKTDVETKDGGGMVLVGTEYVRNKTIGTIVNWTSAASVTKSSGFNISGNASIKVFGVNMTVNMSWNRSTSYTWKKPSGASQFRVLGKGDIKVQKYYNRKTSMYSYVKTTINKTDITEKR